MQQQQDYRISSTIASQACMRARAEEILEHGYGRFLSPIWGNRASPAPAGYNSCTKLRMSTSTRTHTSTQRKIINNASDIKELIN